MTINWKRYHSINKRIQRKSKGRRRKSISRGNQRRLVKEVSFWGSIKKYIGFGLLWWHSGHGFKPWSMQGTRVQALVWEDPTCSGATKPMNHNY